MSALRSLIRDGWVVGIACAAALAYTTLELLNETLTVLLSVLDGVPAEAYEGAYEGTPFEMFDFFPYSAVLNGHLILFEPLLRAGLLFAVTVVASAVALHATRSPKDDAV